MTPSAIKALWAEYTHCEFVLKDPEATMATMTQDPSIMNVPTMQGGQGYEAVYRFYKEQFIPYLPLDYDITTLSCTVDKERLVEEQILRFVHNSPVMFMLPNIAPTGKTIVIPLVVVVTVQQKKIASEHIYWDQASVLQQLGWLSNMQWPVVGAEQATPLKQSYPQNQSIPTTP